MCVQRQTRLVQLVVGGFIVLFFLSFLSNRIVRPDVYITSPSRHRLHLIPREPSFRVKDLPLLGYFLGEGEQDCDNIVATEKPQMLFDHWQIYQKRGFPMISAWGAFLDTRSEFGRGVVLIFAVSEEHTGKTVICQLWSKKNVTEVMYLVITEATYKVIGRGLRKGTVKYYEYLYNCPLPEGNLMPHSVSLTFERCANSTINLPITVLEKPKQFPRQFGICVAAAYNRIDPARIIEWVELNKILGVTEINIYNSNLVSDTLAVLEHYQNEGIIRIHNAPPPIPSWGYWPRKLAVIAGLNDCMYRNMYRYNFTVVIDFDEVIIPHQHLNYEDMFRDFGVYFKGRAAYKPAFQFRNAYFFLDLPPVTDSPKVLVTQRYLSRTKISGSGYSVKSITNPRKCVVMMNHYCLVKLPETKGKFVLNVDPKFALNQHYKKCHLGKECKKMLNETTKEDTMLRFQDTLVDNVKTQYLKLNITFS